MIEATATAFSPAITDADFPAELMQSLAEDARIFSGLKAHAQLLEASRLLIGEDGKPRPFEAFAQDVLRLNDDYNVTYLEAEYLFAQHSALMANKWAGFEEGAGRYNLQYRTAKDDRVRESHAALADTTLPADDAFWDKYYPPNGWRCRCTVVEVRKGKYAESDSAAASAAGEKATTELDKAGNNKLAMFRFNPGKSKMAFPPKNSYTKVAGAQAAKHALEQGKP